MKEWLKRFGGAMDWPSNVSGRGKISDPFGDWDRDGIPNMNDCAPKNPKKQDKGMAPAMQNPGQQFINQEKMATSGMQTSFAAQETRPTESKMMSSVGGSSVSQEKMATSGMQTQMPAKIEPYQPIEQPKYPMNPVMPPGNPMPSMPIKEPVYKPIEQPKYPTPKPTPQPIEPLPPIKYPISNPRSPIKYPIPRPGPYPIYPGKPIIIRLPIGKRTTS